MPDSSSLTPGAPEPVNNEDFYSRVRKRLRRWATTKEGKQARWLEYILVLPDFFYLLCGLALDREVPLKHKAKIGVVIAYIVSPLDLLPEGLLGPPGYTDDVVLAAYALSQLLNHMKPETLLKHWRGDTDLLRLLQGILSVAEKMVGTGVWFKLKRLFGGRGKR